MLSLAEQDKIIARKKRKLSHAHPRDYIDGGVNPYYAWMVTRQIDIETMAYELDLEKRYDFDFVAPEAAAGRGVGLMRQIMIGAEAPSSAIVLDFCVALGITPDMLVPYDGWFPAAPEIVEAAVKYVEMTRGKMPIPEGLQNFLVDCLRIADHLGAKRMTRKTPTHFEVLMKLESHASARMNDSYHEDMTPVNQILDNMDERIARYQRHLDLGMDTFSLVRKETRESRDTCAKVFNLCAQQLAPMSQTSAFIATYRSLIAKFNARNTALIVAEAPEKYMRFRPNWRTSASVRLPDGRFITNGTQVLGEFLRAGAQYAEDVAALQRLATLEKKALAEYQDFKRWRTDPAVQVYLRTEANRRHVLGHVDREEVNMIGDVPMLRPVRSLPAPESNSPGPRPQLF